MANLIGTGLNQVPTNGLLGSMAFQNKEAVSMDLLTTTGSVGVGTTTPAVYSGYTVLDIDGSSNGGLLNIKKAGTTVGWINGNSGMLLLANSALLALTTTGANPIIFNTNSSEKMRLTADGNLGIGTTSPGSYANYTVATIAGTNGGILQLRNSASTVSVEMATIVGNEVYMKAVQSTPLWFGTANTERMRIDSTGYISLGTGAAIQDSLLVFSGSISGTPFRRGIKLGTDPDGQFDFYINSNQNNSMFRWINGNGSAELMRLNSAGNLGLGVTPSAWASSVNALETATGAFYSYKSGSTSVFYMMSNAYFNGTNNIYKTSAAATQYAHFGGAHQWFNAPSGTAGNAVTFTQAMTLDASGNLAIGSTTANRAGASQGLSVEGSSTTVIEANRNGGRAGYMYVDSFATVVGEFRNLPLVFNTNDTERMRITNTGDVGIGTTSPTRKLTVVGSATNTYVGINSGDNASLTGVVFGGTTFPSNGQLLYSTADNSMRFSANGSERMRITADGNIQVGTASLLTTATNGFPYIPTCAGTPTGTPTAITGYAPMVVDSTNNKLYVYVGGAWQAMN